MHFEKLPRLPQRPEQEVELEIWQPQWNCFCCHDSGIVVPHLASMVIDDYDEAKDKFPRCIRPGCRSGSHYDSEALIDSTDSRISAATCKKLDEFERESWRQTVFVHWQRVQQQTQDLAKDKNLRNGDRTPNEEREVQQRKQEVESISHEQWIEQANRYLGSGDGDS